MRTWMSLLAIGIVLAACSRPVPPETVDALAANPEHLKDVMAWCRQDRAKVGEATCVAADEAWRRRFMGDGQPKYTPQK